MINKRRSILTKWRYNATTVRNMDIMFLSAGQNKDKKPKNDLDENVAHEYSNSYLNPFMLMATTNDKESDSNYEGW